METSTKITDKAITDIEDFFNYLQSCGKTDKANKVAYWLKDYVKYLKFEEIFDQNKCPRFQRGDIIKVEFGFNIGSEEGGLHYAVIIGNCEYQSRVLTVIPLTSVKKGKDLKNLRNYEVNCGSALYDEIYKKCNKQLTQLKEESDALFQINGELDNDKKAEIAQRKKNIVKGIQNASKIIEEISNMKVGSIALINQITTISKIRICNPKNKYDVLYGVRMPDEYMDTIDDKIKEFYTKRPKKN